MGDYEGWAQPSGLLPGEAGFVTRPLDRERWAIAEERTAELIARIQPNRPSEERRTGVVKYVQGLIHKCFNCRVFTFGSVPLKTYLPDGDIDLTAFSMHQNLKDTWAKEVCSVLEREEKSEYAEFHVKEVHYIQAEVKIIKCLVENIVVDISFNQLGGLCTLCFLEKVDHLIGQNHLFKRSIILVKAWCYYESRILGAHHGLISTYALETLVLYIFHVFNNSFSGPLEVLYRFLAFFSNFDWDNYCVSLWGPILLSSLPEMAAEPPRKDGGELLLDQQRFLDACSSVYAVFPDGHENQGQSFVSKHFNVVDPLRTSNNLGRSVNKGNFFRIRSAFGFGARQLARILECPIESIISEIDQFFMNTWDRHGRGQRPDAPSPDLWHLQPAQLDSVDNINDNNGLQTFHVDDEESKGKPAGQAQVISQHILPLSIQGDGSKCFQGTPSSLTGLLTHPAGNSSLASPLDQESLTTKAGLSAVSRGGASKSTSNTSHHQQLSALASDQSSKHISEIGSTTKSQKGFKGDLPGGESEDKLRFHFARPRSSPDLRGVPKEVSRGRRSQGETIEALTNQVASLSFDHSAVDRRKMNMSSNSSSLYTSKATVASDALALRRISSQENIGTGNYSETSNCSNSLSSAKESQGTSLAVQRKEAIQADEIMETIVPSHHDEQDPINLTGFQRPQFVNRQSPQIHLPVNFASFQLPVPIGPSLLTSVAYSPANLSGTGHTSLPLADRNWGPGGQLASYSSQQFPQDSAPPLAPYVPNLGIGTHAHSEDPGAFDKLGASGSYHEDEEVQYNPSFWQKVDEHDTLLGPAGGLDMKGVKGYHGGQSESDLANHEKSTSPMGPASATPAPYPRAQKKFVKDARGLPLEGQTDLTMHYSPARFMDDNGVDPNRKAVPTSSFESSSTRISESTWTGAAGRVSKFPKEKRGRGRGNNHVEFSNSKQRETFSSSYGKSNSGWQAEPTLDHPMIGNETVIRDLHSFGAANVDSLNHGDHFSSSLHVSKSSIPPPASDSTLPAHMAVRNIGPISPVPSQVQPTSMSGYDSGSGISSDSVIPGGNLSPVVMGQGPRQRAMDNGGVLPFTFYPTGPPFPFVAMLPLYNIPTDSGSNGDSPTRFDRMGPTDDSIDNHVDQPEHSLDSSSSYDLGECPEQAGIFSSSNMESGDGLFIDHGDEMKSDILHSDFVSHWQNLQFGRFCQNPQLSDPVFYQPQVLIPPMYLQGHFPWDGPGRPLPANMSTLTHLLSYGHRFVPVAALQPNSSWPVGNFQRFSAPNRLFAEELPRYRGGTGTYLPNPRQVPHRDRQSSGSRGNRGNYGQDRNDHGDRDSGWVFIPKNKGGGRGQNKYDGRNQNEKSSSRVERNYEGKGRERGWDSYRHDNLRRGSYQVQHAPFSSGSSSINTGNVMPHGSGGMPYGVYPLPSMNTNGNVPSIPGNGSAVPSVVMLYPYDHNMGFTPEPLEFGSLGPVQLGGSQEGRFNDGIARLNDERFYEHKHKSYQTNSSPGHSPSDQPSSPKQHQRSSMQRSYQLKEEDFPPLRNQSGRGGSNRFSTGNNSSSRNSHYQAFLVTPSS